VNEAAAEEWEDMSETVQQEIKDRVMAACEAVSHVIDRDAVVLGYRQRLERASAVHYPHA
jgi:hypothetical protein